MGLHVGWIAATCDWPALHRALEDHCGTIEDQGAISTTDWFDPPPGQDVLHVSSLAGCTYALDPSMILSANADLIVALSRELSCVVVGTGGETVSGTFWFTAANAGMLRRLHFDIKATLDQPFDLGEPLGSELTAPWDDPDGAGIVAALSSLGFDQHVIEQGPAEGRRVVWRGAKVPATGELGDMVNDHCRVNERPDGDQWTSRIKVVTRDDGGFDLRSEPQKPRKSSLFRRVFKDR